MKHLAAFLVGIALLLAGCGTTYPYTGPVGNYPKVNVVEWRHVDSISDPRNPHWVSQTRLDVANPSEAPMEVVLDCEAKDPTKSVGTYEHMTIPARTVQQVLLGSDDLTCSVARE